MDRTSAKWRRMGKLMKKMMWLSVAPFLSSFSAQPLLPVSFLAGLTLCRIQSLTSGQNSLSDELRTFCYKSPCALCVSLRQPHFFWTRKATENKPKETLFLCWLLHPHFHQSESDKRNDLRGTWRFLQALVFSYSLEGKNEKVGKSSFPVSTVWTPTQNTDSDFTFVLWQVNDLGKFISLKSLYWINHCCVSWVGLHKASSSKEVHWRHGGLQMRRAYIGDMETWRSAIPAGAKGPSLW